MPIRQLTFAPGVIRMNRGDGERVYDLVTDSRFTGANPAVIADKIKAVLQADLEVVQKVRDLPDDDPDKTTDPVATHGEAMFWRGTGGNKDLVGRQAVIDSVVWEDPPGQYRVTVRRCKRPSS